MAHENNDIQTHKELGVSYRAKRMHQLAIREYEAVWEKDASDKMLILDLLQLYNFEGEYAKARQRIIPLLEDPAWQEPYLKNRLINELEIAGKKTLLQSRPRILLVTLTNR
ncbi:MAG: hypothetical protein KKC84_05015, partial [Candidatus Omnitrophica bacterium]|nr:hypothetical protein [Candidatus Omnitrophota bacterium]